MEKKLTKQEEENIKWFLNANIEEILTKSVQDNWSNVTLKIWIEFKKAQYLEMIAFKRV